MGIIGEESSLPLEMVAFPLGKLLYLGIRQISRPISKQLQKTAVRSPFFRKYVCAPPAQGIYLRACCALFRVRCYSLSTSLPSALHKLEMFVKMRLMGVMGPTEVQPLKEEKAVEQGAEIIGELFLYSIAAGFLLFEYYRGVRKERAQDFKQDTEISVLQSQLEKLTKEVEGVRTELHSLEQTVNMGKKPTAKSKT